MAYKNVIVCDCCNREIGRDGVAEVLPTNWFKLLCNAEGFQHMIFCSWGCLERYAKIRKEID